jgi:hypothetical protein
MIWTTQEYTLAAFVLLGFVFGWYALRLYRVSSPWLLVHLAVPLLLMVHLASSYGVWQKMMIAYFLLAANIDCLLATGRLTLPGPDDFERKTRRQVRGTTPRECAYAMFRAICSNTCTNRGRSDDGSGRAVRSWASVLPAISFSARNGEPSGNAPSAYTGGTPGCESAALIFDSRTNRRAAPSAERPGSST